VVDDPHIVPVFEAGESDGVLFIAMRCGPGGDVRLLVRREGVTLRYWPLRRNSRSRGSGQVLITSSGVSQPRWAVPTP
jgi:hypothetical protein